MGSFVSGLLGMNKGSKAGAAARAAGERFAKDVYFRPYTMTSGFGETSYTPDNYSSTLAPLFYAPQATSLLGATNLIGQVAEFSPEQRQADLFQQQAALLQPEFQQQAAQLQSQLFGSGRMGMRLASQGAGAGRTGGFVQPDVFGFQRAQQQTLADLAVKSREQALQEGATLTDMATSLLAQGLGVAELEATLMKLGVDAESARATAAGLAGQVGTGGYETAAQAAMAQDKAMGSLWGSVASAAIGKWSDANLKTNITKIGKLPNGINLYSWDWNDTAKKLGINSTDTIGVIAQEVEQVIPKAVIKDSSGYLKVNYSMLWG